MKNDWWQNLSLEIQQAYDRKDSKTLYHMLRQAYGPKSSCISPLFSKDGDNLLKDSTSIQDRWIEHLSDLFFNPSTVDYTVLQNLSQNVILNDMALLPTKTEVVKAIRKINTGKAPGLDGLYVDVLLHGGDSIHTQIHNLISAVWDGGPFIRTGLMLS